MSMEGQEISQNEANDADLARRLHEELNGPAAVSNPQANIPPARGAGMIECPACTFLNSFKEVVPGRDYTCVQCYTTLSVPISQSTNPSNNQKDLIKCSACQCLNRFPQEKFDAYLCGACCREIKKRKTSADPQKAQTSTTRKIQVRCGECSSINAVQVRADALTVRFECGSCQTVNEVSL